MQHQEAVFCLLLDKQWLIDFYIFLLVYFSINSQFYTYTIKCCWSYFLQRHTILICHQDLFQVAGQSKLGSFKRSKSMEQDSSSQAEKQEPGIEDQEWAPIFILISQLVDSVGCEHSTNKTKWQFLALPETLRLWAERWEKKHTGRESGK